MSSGPSGGPASASAVSIHSGTFFSLAGAYLRAWPEDGMTKPFRYLGPGKHFDTPNQRWLEPGDVMMLDESQAAAWAERFKPEPAAATQ